MNSDLKKNCMLENFSARMINQLRLIVKAIEKGVGEDVKDYIQSTKKTTNNAIRLMRSDNINTNLHDNVASDTLELRVFNRFCWTGCLLIDRLHMCTFSICTKQTLRSIPLSDKNRRSPHYLQSILHVENRDVESIIDQPSLFYYPEEEHFSEEEYRLDYEQIIGNDISFDDKYLHYVIAYETTQFEVTSISILKLDKNFNIAQEEKLERFLTPNFGDLTLDEPDSGKANDVHSLISVKKKKSKPGEIVEKQGLNIVPKRLLKKKQD